jgi:hypothetical protein
VIPAAEYEVGELLWLPTRIDDPSLRVLADDGTVEIDGKPHRVIRWVKLAYQGLAPPEDVKNSMAEVVDTVRYYFSLGSDTVARRVTLQTSRGRNLKQIDVAEVEIDGPLTVADLDWKPPAGVEVVSRDYQPKVEPGDSIYAVGQEFVNFVLPAVDSTGALSVLSLDSVLAKYDMVLFWLWASH